VRYQLLAFDFDGTLADSSDWFVDTLNALSGELNFRPIDPSKSSEYRGLDVAGFCDYVGLPAYKMPKLVLRLREAARREYHKIALFPGIPEALALLRQRGFILAVVSSNAEDTIRKALGDATARQFLHYKCGASIFGKAAKLRSLLRSAQVSAARAIYIGDEMRDADAARKAGLAFGAVNWGYASPEALRGKNPDVIFGSVQDLAGFNPA
jgi:phosphoglycolate phosphatase